MFESRLKSCIVNIKDVQLRQLFARDLHHERYRLNQTFHTCKGEQVSCLAACYKPTTPATSRKSSRVPLVTYYRHCNILTSVGDYFADAWLQAYSVQQSCGFQARVPRKRILQKADNCHKLGQFLIYYCLLLSFLQLAINALFKTANAALITINEKVTQLMQANKTITTRCRNKVEVGEGGGDTTLWKVLVTSGYAHNKNTILTYRPTTVG